MLRPRQIYECDGQAKVPARASVLCILFTARSQLLLLWWECSKFQVCSSPDLLLYAANNEFLRLFVSSANRDKVKERVDDQAAARDSSAMRTQLMFFTLTQTINGVGNSRSVFSSYLVRRAMGISSYKLRTLLRW